MIRMTLWSYTTLTDATSPIAGFRALQGERRPSFDTYDRICKLFGWPQSFVE
jgi:hypothetical protein